MRINRSVVSWMAFVWNISLGAFILVVVGIIEYPKHNAPAVVENPKDLWLAKQVHHYQKYGERRNVTKQ